MKTILFALSLLLLVAGAHAQSEEDKGLDRRHDFVPGIRTGTGYNGLNYYEVGLSVHRANCDLFEPEGMGAYASVEFIPTYPASEKAKPTAFKVGVEHSENFATGMLEIKYVTNFKGDRDFVLCPRIGLGIWTSMSLTYGFNMALNNTFREIGSSQISLMVNIDRLLIGKN